MRLDKRLPNVWGLGFTTVNSSSVRQKKTGFDEKLFEQLDRRATNSLLYSLTMFGSVGLNGMSLTDQLYLAQSNLIREFAQDGPCVIVGRCADHVLRDYPNRYDFFIHGSIQSRVHRIENCDGYEIEGKSAESALERMDKQRSTYYHYYTGKRWGECAHYDLGINAGRIGVEGAVEVILSYIECNRQAK